MASQEWLQDPTTYAHAPCCEVGAEVKDGSEMAASEGMLSRLPEG